MLTQDVRLSRQLRSSGLEQSEESDRRESNLLIFLVQSPVCRDITWLTVK